MACPKSAGNSLSILNGHGVIPITPAGQSRPPLAQVNLEGATALLSEDEARWVRGMVASRGPNRGCLRASRPADPISAYLWRKLAFDLVRNKSGRKPSLGRKLTEEMGAEERQELEKRLEDITELVKANMTDGSLAALPTEDSEPAGVAAEDLGKEAGLPVVVTAEEQPTPLAVLMNSSAWAEMKNLPRYQTEIMAAVERMDQMLSAAPEIPEPDQKALRWLAAYYAVGLSRTGVPSDEKTADALGAWSAQIAFEETLRAKFAGEMSEAGTLIPMLASLQLSPPVARDFGMRRPAHARTPLWWANTLAQNGRLTAYLPLLRAAIGRGVNTQRWGEVLAKSADLLAGQPAIGQAMSADELWESLTSEPTMVLMSGLVGSGKSTLAANLISRMPPKSSFMASLDNVVKQMACGSEHRYRDFFDNPSLSNKAQRKYIQQVMNWMQRAPQLVIFDRMHLDTYARVKSLELFEQAIDHARRDGCTLPNYRRVVISMLQTEGRAERNCGRKLNEELPDDLTQTSIARANLPIYGERSMHRRPGLHHTYDAILYAVPGKNGEPVFRGAYYPEPAPDWGRNGLPNP